MLVLVGWPSHNGFVSAWWNKMVGNPPWGWEGSMIVSRSPTYPFFITSLVWWLARKVPSWTLGFGHDRKCHWSNWSKISIPERQIFMFRIHMQLHPWVINGWNMSSWSFGSDHFPLKKMGDGICRFQPLNLPGCIVLAISFTVPKFNMEPENGTLEWEIPFGNHPFLGSSR